MNISFEQLQILMEDVIRSASQQDKRSIEEAMMQLLSRIQVAIPSYSERAMTDQEKLRLQSDRIIHLRQALDIIRNSTDVDFMRRVGGETLRRDREDAQPLIDCGG